LTNHDDEDQPVIPDENLIFSNTITTRVAGYRYHARTPPGPGAPVQFVREPHNAADPNAIAILDMADRRLGFLFREIAADYAALVDCGCVRLSGRMAAPGEPDFDPARVDTSPVLYVWVFADEVRLAEILARAEAGAAAGGTPGIGTASTGD
jgi:hypothetical protein